MAWSSHRASPALRRIGIPRALGRRARWRRLMIRRLLAIACLAVAAHGIVRALAPPPPPTTLVVIAATDLQAGHLLTLSDVSLARRPAPMAGPTLTVAAEAVGRRLSSPAARGEPITTTRLVPRSVGEGLPADSVALHVDVADLHSLDLVAPGLHVTLHDLTGAEAARGVLVLSIDERPEPDSFGLSAPSAGGGVVVAVPRTDVPRLLAGTGVEARGPVVHLVLDPPPT